MSRPNRAARAAKRGLERISMSLPYAREKYNNSYRISRVSSLLFGKHRPVSCQETNAGNHFINARIPGGLGGLAVPSFRPEDFGGGDGNLHGPNCGMCTANANLRAIGIRPAISTESEKKNGCRESPNHTACALVFEI